MINERFIQDAFSCHDRIKRTLNLEWNPQDSDVVNQEFSFFHNSEGGRIDIIATFENRSKLVICEVKQGWVGDYELRQFLWYLEKWELDDKVVYDETLRSKSKPVG